MCVSYLCIFWILSRWMDEYDQCDQFGSSFNILYYCNLTIIVCVCLICVYLYILNIIKMNGWIWSMWHNDLFDGSVNSHKSYLISPPPQTRLDYYLLCCKYKKLIYLQWIIFNELKVFNFHKTVWKVGQLLIFTSVLHLCHN